MCTTLRVELQWTLVVVSTEDARRQFVRLIHAMTRRRRRQTLPMSLQSSRQLVTARRDTARHLSVQRHFRHLVASYNFSVVKETRVMLNFVFF